MENKKQHNSNRIRTPFQVESLSKEEKTTHESITLLIKVEDGINQKQTRVMERTNRIEKKVEKMQKGGSSSKGKAKSKKERDTVWMNENIVENFHKWSEAERKALMEKFRSLGIKEEALMNDGKGKKKNVFLWDSESEEEDDGYPKPREESSMEADPRSKEKALDQHGVTPP